MKNIKFGLKLWSTNYDLVEQANAVVEDGFFDYVELKIIPESEIALFEKLKAPCIIHLPTGKSGFNIADKEKWESNLELFNQSVKRAAKLDAKYLILHPGYEEMDSAKFFLSKINQRVLIENMPKIGMYNENMLGYTPSQIKELKQDKFGFCLDLNHAIKAAISLKKDYKEFVKEFLELKPEVMHISDGKLDIEKDEHLSIGAGNYDFDFLAKCIKESKAEYLTLETPKSNLNSLQEDLQNLIKLKLYLK